MLFRSLLQRHRALLQTLVLFCTLQICEKALYIHKYCPPYPQIQSGPLADMRYRALLQRYRALLQRYRALLQRYRALLQRYRALLQRKKGPPSISTNTEWPSISTSTKCLWIYRAYVPIFCICGYTGPFFLCKRALYLCKRALHLCKRDLYKDKANEGPFTYPQYTK